MADPERQPVLGGRLLVADTSCWQRRAEPAAREAWSAAMRAGQILTTPIVVMELLYSTRDATEFAAWERRLSALRDAPLDRSTARSAIAALRELSMQRELGHRVPVTDALIAAAAAQRGAGVLHHDRHFDVLAQVLGFESVWLPPRG